MQVGTAMLDELPDGVWFADLAVIDDESMLLTAVCAAVGLLSRWPVQPREPGTR